MSNPKDNKNKDLDDDIKFDDSDDVTLNEDIFDDIEEEEQEVEVKEPETEKPNTTEAEPDEPQVETELEEDISDDPVVEEAIEDIVAHEGDTVLAVEDRAREFDKEKSEAKKSDSRLKLFFKALWSNPKSRWALIISVVTVVFTLALVPGSRYFILNTAKVRASVELKVLDSSTLQPLKNVTVKVANSEAKTNNEGEAKLTNVVLGKTKLQIEKRAFAAQEKDITVGWGSNPLGDFKAEPVGSQYVFYIKDSFSGKPIVKAEAISGEGSAVSDEDGKVVLVLDTAEQEDSTKVSVDIIADTYRKETLNITVNNKETQSVDMVPAKKHAFVSRRSGKYDLYTVDVDGRNEKKIVEGTGFERDDLALIPHPSKDMVAYVATRENTRNSSGYLLSTIYLIDTNTSEVVKIDQSEQIQVVGWSKQGRLIYVKIAAGASGTDPKRHRIISFNSDNHADTKELASSNSFNDVVVANEVVYYAPSNTFQETTPAVFSVSPDGTNQKQILDKEVFSIIRSSYDKFNLSTGSDWYEYTLGSPIAAISSPPSSQKTRMYIDNPASKYSLWADNRDGKGVLINHDTTSDQESTLVERGGLKYPITWLNEKYLIYRIADGRETADYVLNIDGGEPRKISDVSDSDGVSKWAYF